MAGGCEAVVVAALAANLAGALLAAWDKRVAVRRGAGRSGHRSPRRVPENVFHVVAALGGWPLTLAFLVLVRHKVRKPRFLAPFALAALVGAALVWAALAAQGCAPFPSRWMLP